MQKWKKFGRIFNPDAYGLSYAAVPLIQQINEKLIKIYFSTRNKDNKSIMYSLMYDSSRKIITGLQPLCIPLGDIGYFDEDGVMGTAFHIEKEKIYLYYIGWSRSLSTPFRNAIGLAISYDDGISFQKYSDGPILDRSIYDKCFVASCHVLKENNTFKMWYLSCDRWLYDKDNLLKHFYNIKYATSNDGINWERKGIIAIDYLYENEYAISVPRVIKDGSIYKMWYSYRGGLRGDTYRVGYAESNDGVGWTRKDKEIGIDVSETGWDSEMICYPFVFDYNGNRYMLYNGNGYGKTGFGLAVLEQD